jgi:1,4-dihydroxy-2-naphthoate octaprenyltransferase
MRELARRVGLGLAARGDIEDTVEWARLARDAGLEGIWIHDSYFERDAITYGTAIASALAMGGRGRFRVALGAVNPYTRHPVVLAMTGSALDEILPERIVMGLGTGLPLRLGQMGIPYSPDEAVARVGGTIDQLRTLWAGERVPSATPGLPPIQPMFPPVHRIPLYVAAYRREFVELAGRKADGYLARPCESVPSLRGILERLRASAEAAGRDPAEVDTAAYLLSLVDRSRREALNRAKREPFVIYMMSVLSDVSLARAGFEKELRDRIAAAWRAEEYHEAGKLIPDDLLDAFMLCGTREDVAERANLFRAGTGLELPLLQPVVQDESQTLEIIEAARLYASLPDPIPATTSGPVPAVAAGVPAVAPGVAAIAQRPQGDHRLGPLERVRRRAGAAYEILRPFAYTASAIPVAAGGALAYVDSRFELLPFLAALAAGMLLHSGTNVTNEVFDVRRGVDKITSPRASHAILKGRMSERSAYFFAISLFAAAALIGVYLVALRGPVLLALGLLGLVAGYTYTAPPLQLKYHALGLPLVSLLMGPLMVAGSYFAVTGTFDPRTMALAVPIGLLVGAIIHGNEWRDIGDDSRAGISTVSSRLGPDGAHYTYLSLVIGAYVAVAVAVALEWLPPTVAVALFSLPFLARVVRAAEFGAAGQARAIAMIDVQTARLHLAFGTLLVVGLISSRMLPG